MAKIARKNQKIFGSNAGATEIGQFGSLKAASPAYTTDPETIQALSNYLDGWYEAVIGGNSPAIQDMNALCYLFGYQLSYLFQAGVPEWNTDTTYYIGSLVQSGGILYRSITDTNSGNDPASSAEWGSPYQFGTLSPNAINRDMDVASGQSLTWANGVLDAAATMTIDSGGNFVGLDNFTNNGNVVVNGDFTVL